MDNADLEKLKITPGKLVPKFKPSVTEYSMTVGSGVGEVKLSPLTSDSGASCNIKVSLQLPHAKIMYSLAIMRAPISSTPEYNIRNQSKTCTS